MLSMCGVVGASDGAALDDTFGSARVTFSILVVSSMSPTSTAVRFRTKRDALSRAAHVNG